MLGEELVGGLKEQLLRTGRGFEPKMRFANRDARLQFVFAGAFAGLAQRQIAWAAIQVSSAGFLSPPPVCGSGAEMILLK